MEKSIRVLYAACFAAMVDVLALTSNAAAPLKQEEIDALVYGGFVMVGIGVYFLTGWIKNRFFGKNKKEKDENDK